MRIIAIVYDGRGASINEVEEMLNNCPFIEDGSQPNVTQYDEDKIIGLVVNASHIPGMHTEDGDESVKVITHMTNGLRGGDFSVKVVKKLANIDITKDDDRAFVKACSFLSKSEDEAPVSTRVADKYRFTATKREIIRQLYKAFENRYE